MWNVAGGKKAETDRTAAGNGTDSDLFIWRDRICCGGCGGAVSDPGREDVLFWKFFEELCRQFQGIEQETLYDLWKKAIAGSRLAEGMDKEDVALWQEVGMQLGTLERKTQLQTLQVLRERLHRQALEAESEYKAQARVYRLTGVTGGIFMVILLL